MSFSYGSVPEPESPPLKALALSPAPARTDRRAKRHTTLSPPDISSLNLNDDPLSLDGSRRISESSLHRSVSARPSARTNTGATTVMSAMSIHQSLSTYNSSAGTLISPVPRMINPLPAHYRHPSPSPSYESSTPSLTSTAADSACSSFSAASSASNASNASSLSGSTCGSGVKTRKTLVTKPSLNNICQRAKAPHNSDDSLSSSCEPHTPTSTTFSRSRGKSISRAVGKLASDFLSLKKKDKENKDRTDSESIPAVPALPNYRK